MSTQESSAEFIRVYSRIRPARDGASDYEVLRFSDNKQLLLRNVDTSRPGPDRKFGFDAVFGTEATQEEVFSGVAERVIQGCINGYNGTIFAYGQTGSGKTHTMLGPCLEGGSPDKTQEGLIPRALQMLFDLLEDKSSQLCHDSSDYQYDVGISFVELYNEAIFDLLEPNKMDVLRLRRDEADDVYIENAAREHVSNVIDAMRVVTKHKENGVCKQRKSCVNLVDLAGSERQKQAQTSGQRFKESVHINTSLTVLGRVIRTLSAASRDKMHVPYRESLLTHLLKDSLGGKARTAVVVNVHPNLEYYSETLSTLQFAQSVRLVKNALVVNEELKGDSVYAFQKEISRLEELNRRQKEAHEQELESKNEEVFAWKENAVVLERQLAAAKMHHRQASVIAKGFNGEKSWNEDVEKKLWNETMSAIQRSIRGFSATNSITIQSFEVAKWNEEKEQLMLDKEELKLEIDRLREQNAELQMKNQKYLEDALTPKKKQFENMVKENNSNRMTPQARKERRTTRYTPRNISLRPIFDATEEQTEAGGDLLQKEKEAEEKLAAMEKHELELEMSINCLQQVVAESQKRARTLEELLEASNEKESEAKERAEKAERKAIDAEEEREKAEQRSKEIVNKLKEDLHKSLEKIHDLQQKCSLAEASTEEWKAEAERVSADAAVMNELYTETKQKQSAEIAELEKLLEYEENRQKRRDEEQKKRLDDKERLWTERMAQAAEEHEIVTAEYRSFVERNRAQYEEKIQQFHEEFGLEREILKEANAAEVQRREKAEQQLASVVGHANHTQKIRMMDKYKEQMNSMKLENDTLKAENVRLKKLLPRSSSTSRSTAD